MSKWMSVDEELERALKDFKKKTGQKGKKVSNIIGTELPEIVDTKVFQRGKAGKEMEITFRRRFKI